MNPLVPTRRALGTLTLCHCAGWVDLIVLPIWVGTLIAKFRYDPAHAGGLLTLYLIGAAVAGLVFAPRFHRFTPRLMAIAGFAVAGTLFVAAAQGLSFPVMAALHLLAGLMAGTGLSFTDGTIGHTANPHRGFAVASFGSGVFGTLFLSSMPSAVARFGGASLFYSLAAFMWLAAIAAALYFPRWRPAHVDLPAIRDHLPPISSTAWLVICGISLLALNQALTMSFYEHIGVQRGFRVSQISADFAVNGIVALTPGLLAGLLEKRLSPIVVICSMPVFQAVMAMVITHTSGYFLWAAAGPLMSFTTIFTNIFALGLLARLDPTSRAVAGTPAILMVGSALSPFIGGALVRVWGFGAIGLAVTLVMIIDLCVFNQARRLNVRRQGRPLSAGSV